MPEDDNSIEILTASLMPLVERNGCVSLHCTSARSSGGVTEFTARLAASLARSRWCRTLVIDPTPRNGVTNDGLPVLMRHPDAKIMEEPVRFNLPETAVVHAALCHGAALPRRATLRQLYQQLAARFDVVLISAPPVLDMPEVGGLAGAADGVVLVIERERDRANELKQARDLLVGAGAKLLGVAVGQADPPLPRMLSRWL